MIYSDVNQQPSGSRQRYVLIDYKLRSKTEIGSALDHSDLQTMLRDLVLEVQNEAKDHLGRIDEFEFSQKSLFELKSKIFLSENFFSITI